MAPLSARDCLTDALKTDGTFMASLVTRGRNTGRQHTVRLKAVSHLGMVYFSRHRPDSDWYLNAAANLGVHVIFESGNGAGRCIDDGSVGESGALVVPGTAVVIQDKDLLRQISEIKYPGQARAAEPRVAIGVALDLGM